LMGRLSINGGRFGDGSSRSRGREVARCAYRETAKLRDSATAIANHVTLAQKFGATMIRASRDHGPVLFRQSELEWARAGDPLHCGSGARSGPGRGRSGTRIAGQPAFL